MSILRITCKILSLVLVVGASACGSESVAPPPVEEQQGAPLRVSLFQPVSEQRLTTATAVVSGRVTAEALLASLEYRLEDGAPVALAVEADRREQGFDAVVEVPEGRSHLVVTATDTQGRTASAEVVFVRTPPPVTFTSPWMGARPATSRVRVTGTVNDAAITEVSWRLNGDAPVVLGAPGSRPERLDFDIQPTPGANTLVVTTRDALGNQRETTQSFFFGSQTGAGGLHSGAVRDGVLYTWGRNNRGQLGVGSTTDAPTPQRVTGLENVAALVIAQNDSLALRADGSVWMWGDNGSGQLGQGTPGTPDTTLRSVPTRVPGISDAVMGSLGYTHTLVLHRDGHVSAFGKNNNGQLGDGTAVDRHYPVPVVGLTDAVRVLGGSQHSAALRADGTVWVWGRNTYGNLGTGLADAANHPTPTQVPGLTDVVDLANGRDHLLALHRDGTVSAWGLNASGQLGDGKGGKDSQSATPVKVRGLQDATAVYAQGNMSFARRRDGTVWGWGQNFNGQLATGDTTELSVPTTPVLLRVEPQEALVGLIDVAPGATHAVALHQDGTVYAWGWSSKGSLGRADLLENWPYPLPHQVVLP